MTISSNIEKLRELETPFYYYDLDVLRSTIEVIKKESADTFGKYIELHEIRRGDL